MSEERGPRGVEWLLLLVLAAIAGFSLLATGAVRPIDFVWVEYLTAAALGVSLIRLWTHPQPTFHLSPVLWFVIAFTLYCGVQASRADIPYAAEDEFFRVISYAVFFILFVLHVFRPQYLQTFLGIIAVLAVGSCLYAVYQYFSNSDRVWNFIRPATYTRRGSGTFINPNSFAGYMAVLLPVALSFIIAGRMKITARMIIAYAAFMFLAGLLVAASRGALVGAAVGIVVLSITLVRQSAFRIPAIVMIGVLIFGGFAFAARDSLAQKRVADTQNVQLEKDTRILLWQSAYDMWQDHRLTGVGPGLYDDVYPQYRPTLLQKRQPLYVHNEYLHTLADYGLIGAVLVLLTFGAAEIAFRYSLKRFRRDGENLDNARSNRLALIIGASSGISAALAHAFFDYNFHMPAYAELVIFLLALLAIFWRTDNQRWWWRPRLAGKLTLTVLCLAIAAGFVWHGYKRGKEQALWQRWERADINKPIFLELLSAAQTADPRNARSYYEIGEYHRMGSWTARGDYQAEGRKAMEWYAKAATLNPHDSYIPLRQGMTLAWIEDFKGMKRHLDLAEKLNPNDYYTLSLIGWCYMQQRDYPTALKYLERSHQLHGYDNSVVETYLQLVRDRVKEMQKK